MTCHDPSRDGLSAHDRSVLVDRIRYREWVLQVVLRMGGTPHMPLSAASAQDTSPDHVPVPYVQISGRHRTVRRELSDTAVFVTPRNATSLCVYVYLVVSVCVFHR